MRVEYVTSTVSGGGGGIPIRDYRPSTPAPTGAPFVWVHGGAFVWGSTRSGESHLLASELARAGRRVVTMDYRLVPAKPFLFGSAMSPSANRFPAAESDVHAVLREIITACGPDVIVGGASAGACLTAAALRRMRDEGEVLPRAAVFAYGTFHAELPPFSAELAARIEGRQARGQFTPERTRRMNVNYVGSTDRELLAQAFPGGSSLASLPPSYLLDADHDALRASGEAFAGELSKAGVPVQYEVLKSTRHGFLANRRSRGFAPGVARIASWLAEIDRGWPSPSRPQ